MRPLTPWAPLLLVLGACAVGPSTRVEQPVPSVVPRTAEATTPSARRVLDSLAGARADDHAPPPSFASP